jgi:hypothetical protein
MVRWKVGPIPGTEVNSGIIAGLFDQQTLRYAL